MAQVNQSFQVTLKKQGEHFEVLVDFEELEKFRKDPNKISVYDVLSDTKIFKDQKKGEIASDKVLYRVFNAKNEEEMLKEILIEGEVQIPASHKNKQREQKKEQIISYIVENATNPQTQSKFTPTMIESEVSKLKVNIDAHKSTSTQAENIVKILSKTLPISLNKVTLEIKVPSRFVSKFYGPFRKLGIITKEQFDNHKTQHLHIQICESRLQEVEEQIKNLSKGEAEYRTIKS